MYRKQVRRRRAVLLMLVVASFAFLSLYVREGQAGPFHRMQRAVATVMSPFQGVADRALKPARDTINWFDETFQARGDNHKLHAQLGEYRSRLAKQQLNAIRGGELRALDKLAASGVLPAARKRVTARVIARSPTVWYSTVTISAGTGSRVAVDDPVITGDGLVGRVSSVTRNSAQVTLITDHTSSVAARVLPVDATGVVEPQIADPKDLLLNFVENGRRINEGQIVVTAGFSSGSLDSLFPPGIPIGEISQSTRSEQQAYQRVHLRPFADLRDMELVQVLT